MSERRRRIVRALVIGLAGAAVLALGASLLLRIGGERALERERTAFVDRWGPVDAAAFQRPAVAEERNAAAWIKAGAAAIVWSNADRTLIQRLSVHPAQEWSEEQRTAVLEVVEGNRAAIELLGRAVGLPDSSWGIDYRQRPEAELPELLEVLNAARLALASARLGISSGDVDEAVDHLAVLSAMTATLERESVLIVSLIGIAIDRITSTVAGEILGAPGIDRPTLERIAQVLPGREPDPVDATMRSIRFEVGMTAGRWERAGAASEGLRARLVPITDWLAAATYEEVSELLRAAHGSLADMQELEDRPQPSLLHLPRRVAMATTPNIRSAVGRALAAAAQRQLVRAAIEVRRRGIDEGRYPGERDAVAALDEPDPLSGQRLGYRVEPSGAAELWVEDLQELLREIGVPSASVDATTPIRLPAP